MLVIDLVACLLLLAGPIVGYDIGWQQSMPTRWSVMAWAAAGGAVAAIVLVAVLLLAVLVSDATVIQVLRRAIPYVTEYALFGLVLGFAGVLTRDEVTLRLIITALAMLAVALLIQRPLLPGRALFEPSAADSGTPKLSRSCYPRWNTGTAANVLRDNEHSA